VAPLDIETIAESVRKTGRAVIAADTPDLLSRRVLAREHVLLVETLRLFAAGRVALVGDHVVLDGRPLPAPLQLAANNQFA
jgi:phosphoribosylglycinamide formyltransferase-1